MARDKNIRMFSTTVSYSQHFTFCQLLISKVPILCFNVFFKNCKIEHTTLLLGLNIFSLFLDRYNLVQDPPSQSNGST